MACLSNQFSTLLLVTISISLNIAFLCYWVRPNTPISSVVKTTGLGPLLIAIQIHWFLFFGPINFFSACLHSSHQELYPWVINREYLASGMLVGLTGYITTLTSLLIIANLVSHYSAIGTSNAFDHIPHESINKSVLIFAVIVLIISLWISPVIGTIDANNGAWYEAIPYGLRLLAKGLFLVEACPLIYSGWIVITDLLNKRVPESSFRRLHIVAFVQILAFLTLRQRFLSILAIIYYGFIVLCRIRSKVLVLGIVILLLLGYVVPSGLRYTRLAPHNFDSTSDYLEASTKSFLIGLQPQKILSSALTDISYNKSGAAALSVPIGISRNIQPTSFDWLLVEIHKALPSTLRSKVPEWGDSRSEKRIGQLLGVGEDGKPIPGVSPEVQEGWVIDMMETPFLEPLTNSGITGVILFSLIFSFFISLIWLGSRYCVAHFSFAWPIPAGILYVVSTGPSWIGDILTLLKVVMPWILVCLIISKYETSIGGRLPSK